MPLFDASRGSDWKENGAGHRFAFLLYGGISRRQPRYPAATSWAGSFASLPCDSFADVTVFRRNVPRLVGIVIAITIEVNITRQMALSDRRAGLVVAHNMSRASIEAGTL